jgi:NodT family efflux transporter outer membrane factor (OMF) lipoprotein
MVYVNNRRPQLLTTAEENAMRAERAAALPVAIALSLGACAALPPNDTPRGSQRPTQELQLSATVAQIPVDAKSWPADTWWNAFGDPQLDRLESEALARNPSMKIAQARLEHAVAVAGTARASLAPDVAAELSSTRERFSEHDIIPQPFAGSTRTESRLSLDLSYELDLWGKNRAALTASLDRAAAERVDLFAARLLLSAAVARTYVELERSYDHLEIAQRTLIQRQRIYDLTRERVAAGLDTRVELRQAEAQIPATREEIASLEEAVTVARHQLAALLGEGPDRGLSIQRPELPSEATEALLPSRLPADLLGRRPDVEASRLRAEAASHDIKAARAQFYPNINLLGFLGFQSIELSQFLEAGSRTAGIGPAVRLPVFEGGRLRSQLAGANADYHAAVEQYNRTLIEALQELADQLAACHSVAVQSEQQRLAMDAARDAYELALMRYREGVGSYLSVLSAETQVLTQENLAADLRARGRVNRINLVRALGGGFDATAHASPLAKD